MIFNLNKTIIIIFFLLSLMLTSCSLNQDNVLINIKNLELNPYNLTPLVAFLNIEINESFDVNITIIAKDKNDKDLSVNLHYDYINNSNFKIPIIGLYPNHTNEVIFELKDNFNKTILTHKEYIKTKNVPSYFPNINIQKINDINRFIFVNWIPSDYDNFNSIGILYDLNGNVRWYSEFNNDSNIIEIKNNSIFVFPNGNGILKKFDFTGKKKNTWDLEIFGYTRPHHDIFIKENGNFLILVSKINETLINNHLIEIEPKKEILINEWDLRDFFPNINDLFDYSKNISNNILKKQFLIDLIHPNAVYYDKRDDSIIVSSQRSGILKIDNLNNLKWFLTFHMITLENNSFRKPINFINDSKYWNYNEFLLQPIDKNNKFILDDNVLDGLINHKNFSWPFRPHKPIILKNGNLLIHDNGIFRNFNKNISFLNLSNDSIFSRAVEYKVNEKNKTIKQIWSYELNKYKGINLALSPITGDVDELDNGNRLITFGSIGSSFIYGDNYTGFKGAVIVEVNPKNNEELFKLTLERKNDNIGNVPTSVYRAELLDFEDLFN